jgi:hypothetical protein
MNTRKYPRTLDEAFPFGARSGCAIEKPRRNEIYADYLLAIAIGIFFAVILFIGLSQ